VNASNFFGRRSMDKVLEELMNKRDLGKIPPEEFNKYMEAIDDMPRRGFRLLGEFFESPDDDDIVNRMISIFRMATFVVAQKIHVQENGVPKDMLSEIASGIETAMIFDKLQMAVAAGFTAGVAFAIDQMAKCDEEAKK